MNFKKFLKKNPLHSKIIPFKQSELENLEDKVPDDLMDFFKTFGRCSFNNGFFSTVHPLEIESKTIFKAWGFKKGEYYIFLKSCFGLLLYYNNGEYNYLDPQQGERAYMVTDLDVVMNNMLTTGFFVDNVFKGGIFNKRKNRLTTLKSDEIYMLIPALPLGGSFETSKLEPGKMLEHLCLLADLHGNKTWKL